MPRARKAARDLSQLSGKPLSDTLQPSDLHFSPSPLEWVTSPDLCEKGLRFPRKVIYDLNLYLLANPNRNSSCLFRGDILFDSLGSLQTPEHEEKTSGTVPVDPSSEDVEPLPPASVPGFNLTRTVVRRLIPRNPRLDPSLDQTCHFYEASEDNFHGSRIERTLLIMAPHVSSKEEVPFYHPMLRALAFLYDFKHDPASPQGEGTVSLHFLPYPEPISVRLERTLSSLLNSQVRLARNALSIKRPGGANENPIKDNVLPKHRVQDTYTWLKEKYAQRLCQKWVEDTEPSKHVFEDLAITAFFIELWRSMYGVLPMSEREQMKDKEYHAIFPGFVDVACGNGVLVYVLRMEGYQGWGFDARRRKTWNIFPESVQENLKEAIYIPKPFADVLTTETDPHDIGIGVETLTGMFPKDTFIISNHADELTVWTPLMAAISNPDSPLPFLSIPCCSHSLSGARHRYPPPKEKSDSDGRASEPNEQNDELEQNRQPRNGDLKALRAEKQESQTDSGMYKSAYGCLTAKTMKLAEEIGYEVERTLIRIPSTRNMGIVGGRRQTAREWSRRFDKPGQDSTHLVDSHNQDTRNATIDRITEIVHRECSREGGVEMAARTWIERARGLHKGQGRGNQPRH